jgi:hypothetical protein
MKPNVFMHSLLAPDDFADALRRKIDPEQRTLFSWSGYKGDQPILGEVGNATFRLQKRRYSRNDFAGHFYGTFKPESGGTRIEGYFALPRWARYFMRVWLAFAVLCGVPIFIATLRDVLTGSHEVSGDTWVGLVVPPLLIFVGTGMPMLTRRFGRNDRRFMVEFVQHAADARVDNLETSIR